MMSSNIYIYYISLPNENENASLVSRGWSSRVMNTIFVQPS
jgi:hypothetical protein